METCCIRQTSCIKYEFNTALNFSGWSNTQIVKILYSSNTVMRFINIVIKLAS